ncbi:MAG: ATPase involved in DNA repair [Gallionellaceae bacterium]|nr:MAG: ATPase involved in DNA repair [Gallionellaceae bacterium]
MLLESLTLCDFGLFRGEHAIDLTPRKKYNNTRPIILFGGLNGTGKTTILAAIRLAIYGKQALGYATGQKTYDEYLTSKIHRNPHAPIAQAGAHICLEFLFYKLGKPLRYKVVRSWTVSGKQVKETLTIFQDGEPIPEFTHEQCQAFLNELIPLGVSELFFFDGEKIASLAEEGGDVALRDAIRKLLGLDIIERLKSDLHIHIRRQNSKSLPEDTKALLDQYEVEYTELKQAISSEEDISQQLLAKLTAAQEQRGRLEETLASRGGAWALSRQVLKTRRDKLIVEKKQLEAEAREHLGGLYPTSLSPKLMQQLKDQLLRERSLKEWETVSKAFSHRLNRVNSVITEFVPKQKTSDALQKVKAVFADLVVRPTNLKAIKLSHDLTGKDSIQLESWVDESLSHVKAQSSAIRLQLDTLDEELGKVSLQIERAPDQESLKSSIDAIQAKNEEIIQLTSERNLHLELARRYTWKAIEMIRRIRRLEESLISGETQGSGTNLAKCTIDVLTDFAEEMTKRKIVKLEQEFAKTFSHLARKTDAIVSAQIDPTTFEVHLFNKSGKSISKRNLSAGEKQIYAIAMLEALAKTSGRMLPIIIDTPLGRLDSHHREKLINNYFPQASHQVIILSTDTEVDMHLYGDLRKNISHCYHINYDALEGTSAIKEGYFWESNLDNKGTIAHAS